MHASLCGEENQLESLDHSKVMILLMIQYNVQFKLSTSVMSLIKDVYHMMNWALGMVHMANHSSMFCPLTLRGGMGRSPAPPTTFPLFSYDPSLWYHSSAVLALALDTVTVPYRLRQNSAPMWQLADALTVSGRKVS
ncbi:hypothetical protein KOW79_012708 [Hemibagrus wyckioides]|uniref:Uncharacterized protein n=1 Tax=Hemibagrus wyckioides TaxID=337641 RepID=A0A9D3NPM9_9TELE|nr:hypothetical protein KOW79_012708 [Hemibagrus wyckioides]